MLRWMSAGESHGPALVGILEGMPAGVAITTAKVGEYIASRRAGYGRGARQKFEQDRAHLVGGVIRGKTTGAPIALLLVGYLTADLRSRGCLDLSVTHRRLPRHCPR